MSRSMRQYGFGRIADRGPLPAMHMHAIGRAEAPGPNTCDVRVK